jgi:diacylglycerol O-acyltransferase / wax synthase
MKQETATGSGWGTEPVMNDLEAMMWRAEADPRLRSTGIFVDRLDRAPDWARLRAAHEWAVGLVPRLRQRVHDDPLSLSPPVWALDPNFDLDYHLRRVNVPAPGHWEQVLEIAQTAAMTPLDRARPLWEATLVEGLQNGEAAYLLKLHHCLTDGQASVQLFDLLHSDTATPAPAKPQLGPAPQAAPAALDRRAGVLVDSARGAARLATTLGRDLARRPGPAVRDAVRFGRSLARLTGPPPAPPSPLMRERGLTRRFGVLEVPLGALRAAGRAAGGSLNDAYLAAIAGGLGRYHTTHGVDLEVLPMAFPVSLRRDDHPMGGNRFAGARIAGPVGISDPAERIAAIRELVLTAREEPALDFMGLLAPALARVPAAVLTRLSQNVTSSVDLQASNIPGLARPAYIAGSRITRMYPFGPVPGSAVMVTLISHDGVCCIGVNADALAIPDTDTFLRCLREGFDEVLALVDDGALETSKAV